MTSSERLTQTYTGRAIYLPDHEVEPDRLLIAVPCFFGGLVAPTFALLDTGSTWTVLDVPLAERLGCDLTPDASTPPIRTARHGVIHGRLERFWVRIPAVDGGDLDLQAMCFVSPDWYGPVVLGWKGCLESIRLGLDPTDDSFYFANL